MDIEILNLSKSFEGKIIFDNFSCIFKEKECNIVVGKSGIGKTTLINILLGLEKPDSGSIIGAVGRIGAVFQEDRLCPGTVREALSMVLDRQILNKVNGKKTEYIYQVLSELKIENLIDKRVETLSGGERRRVAIARSIAYSPDIYIFDEAFKGLDEKTKKVVLKYVNKSIVDKTTILITHDPKEVEFFGGRVITLGLS